MGQRGTASRIVANTIEQSGNNRDATPQPKILTYREGGPKALHLKFPTLLLFVALGDDQFFWASHHQ